MKSFSYNFYFSFFSIELVREVYYPYYKQRKDMLYRKGMKSAIRLGLRIEDDNFCNKI